MNSSDAEGLPRLLDFTKKRGQQYYSKLENGKSKWIKQKDIIGVYPEKSIAINKEMLTKISSFIEAAVTGKQDKTLSYFASTNSIFKDIERRYRTKEKFTKPEIQIQILAKDLLKNVQIITCFIEVIEGEKTLKTVDTLFVDKDSGQFVMMNQ